MGDQPQSRPDTAESDQDDYTVTISTDLSEVGNALADLHQGLTQQLVRIEEDGERIKRLVGEVVVMEAADPRRADDLRHEIATLCRKQSDSEENVDLPEIAFALWIELNRLTQLGRQSDTNNGVGDSTHEPKPQPPTESTTPTSNGTHTTEQQVDEEEVEPGYE